MDNPLPPNDVPAAGQHLKLLATLPGYRGNKRETVFSLIGDQPAQLLGFAMVSALRHGLIPKPGRAARLSVAAPQEE